MKTWHADHKEHLTFGQKAADHMRNAMGSWTFVIGFLMGMVVWSFAAHSFDPYPFTFLNLILSMLAGLQGAILLIAAKRQDEISAALAQHDFNTNVEAKKEIEELMKRLDNLETEKLDKIIDWIGVLLKAEIDRRKREGTGNSGKPGRRLS